MRTRLALLAVVAMFGLTAAKCTPEQVAEVEAYYRASIEAQGREPRVTVTATCESVTLHAENWPDDSVINIGVANEPGTQILATGGVADFVWPVWAGHGTYTWTVTGLVRDGRSTVAESGTVECGPGLPGSGEWGTPP